MKYTGRYPAQDVILERIFGGNLLEINIYIWKIEM